MPSPRSSMPDPVAWRSPPTLAAGDAQEPIPTQPAQWGLPLVCRNSLAPSQRLFPSDALLRGGSCVVGSCGSFISSAKPDTRSPNEVGTTDALSPPSRERARAASSPLQLLSPPLFCPLIPTSHVDVTRALYLQSSTNTTPIPLSRPWGRLLDCCPFPQQCS